MRRRAVKFAAQHLEKFSAQGIEWQPPAARLSLWSLHVVGSAAQQRADELA